MNWIGISILLIIGIVFWNLSGFRDLDFGKVVNFIRACFLSVICNFILAGGCIIICQMFFMERNVKTESHYVNLVGLSNGSGINGHFFLGNGQINNEQYIFYNASANGFIKTYKAKMDNSMIKIDGKNQIEYVHKYDKFPKFIGIFYGFDDNDLLYKKETEYIFHMKKEDVNMRNYYDVSKY